MHQLFDLPFLASSQKRFRVQAVFVPQFVQECLGACHLVLTGIHVQAAVAALGEVPMDLHAVVQLQPDVRILRAVFHRVRQLGLSVPGKRIKNGVQHAGLAGAVGAFDPDVIPLGVDLDGSNAHEIFDGQFGDLDV